MNAILIFILSVLLAIPMGVIANLITPHIKNWWAKSSAFRAEKRLGKIESEHSKILFYNENKQDLIIYISKTILQSLTRLAISGLTPLFIILVNSMFPDVRLFDTESENYIALIFTLSISYTFFGIAFVKSIQCANIIQKVVNFDSYQIKTDQLKTSLTEIASREMKKS